MKTQHIIGTLTPEETQTITPELSKIMHKALVTTGLVGVISADRAKLNNKIELNHSAVVSQGNHAPLHFIGQLKEVLWRLQVAGLKLNGCITITVTGTNPVIYRVLVENSTLSYKNATVRWNEPSRI